MSADRESSGSEQPGPGAGRTRRRVPPLLIGALVAAAVLLIGLVAGLTMVFSGGDSVSGRPVAEPPSVLASESAAASASAAVTTDRRARQVAETYALGVASIDYRSTAAWRAALTWHTTPELATKLNAVSGSMIEILTPMQWVAVPAIRDTAIKQVPGGATVIANVHLQLNTTSSSNPGGSTSEVTYVITMDPARDFLITDVGGDSPTAAMGIPTGLPTAAAPTS